MCSQVSAGIEKSSIRGRSHGAELEAEGGHD